MLELSIIIVNYKANKLVENLTKTIPKKKTYEIIVVDNSIVNRGFAAACNLGEKKAKGKYLLFLNPDTKVGTNAIELMLKKIKSDTRIGLLGPQLIDGEGRAYLSTTKQPTFTSSWLIYSFLNTLLPNNKYSIDYWYKQFSLAKTRQVESISGAVMLIPKKLFNEIGGFDDRYFLYWEDYDLCRKIISAGKQILYFPQAKFTHFLSQTTPLNSSRIKGIFRTNRWRFFAKHFGLFKGTILETWLTATEEWRLLLIIVLAAFLRFDRLPQLMPLIGDQGRDFLAAQTALQTKELPLLGISSSIPRFKQGPIHVWFLIAILAIFGNDPVYAGILAATLGVLAVIAIYLLVERYLGRFIATISALILATAPLAVTQSRLAFCTDAIPLFSVMFLWRIWKKPQNIRDFLWLGLAFALLFQFELATVPLVVLIGIKIWRTRRIWPIKYSVINALTGIGFGLLPQLLFDLTHKFQQIGLFVVWLLYRLISFFGFDPEHTVSAGGINLVISRLSEYGQRFMSPWSNLIWGFLGLAIIGWLWLSKRNWYLMVIWWWCTLLLIGFFIQSGPSEAYFPALFIPISLILAELINRSGNKQKLIWLFFLGVVTTGNVVYLRSRDYGVATPEALARGYIPTYGQPLYVQQQIARIIGREAYGKPIYLSAYGEGAEFASVVDNYRYLLTGQELVEDPEKAYLRVWFLYKGAEKMVIPDAHVYVINGTIFAMQK